MKTLNPIKINETIFRSIREASRFIHAEEYAIGNKRNVETIRKELKNINDGKRREGIMYLRYAITIVTNEVS